MFNNVALDIAIGIIFIFLVYSLLASAINEIVAAMIAQRGRMLARGIQRMLNGESIYWWHNLENMFRKKSDPSPRHRRFKNSLADLFKQHTMFKRLAKNDKPSYLSDGKFADILLDIFHQKGRIAGDPLKNKAAMFEPTTFESVKKGLLTVLEELETKSSAKDCKGKDPECYKRRQQELYEIFNVLLDQANGDLQQLKKLVENWYNEMMDRVSGWYKKQTHQVLLVIGLGLALFFNVDSIQIVRDLSRDKTARETLLTMADSYIKDHPKGDTVRLSDSLRKLTGDSVRIDSSNYKLADSVIKIVYHEARSRVDSVNTLLGLGWGDYGYAKKVKKDSKADPPGWLGKIFYVVGQLFSSWQKFLGLLFTALAISLGSPFWFDILNKLVNLRMSGRSPDDQKSSTATGQATQPITIKIDRNDDEAVG